MVGNTTRTQTTLHEEGNEGSEEAPSRFLRRILALCLDWDGDKTFVCLRHIIGKQEHAIGQGQRMHLFTT